MLAIEREASAPSRGTRAWWRRPAVDLFVSVAACLLPLLIFTLAWGPSWLVDSGSADNWSYVKYFQDWTSSDPVLRAWMAIDYKSSRVAWILIGYLAYQVFGPLTGTMVLSAGVAVLGILATLALTWRLFGRRAGTVATLLTSAYGGFYSSGIPGFWSYHGAICAVFYTLFLLALAETARRRGSRAWSTVAGITGAWPSRRRPTTSSRCPRRSCSGCSFGDARPGARSWSAPVSGPSGPPSPLVA